MVIVKAILKKASKLLLFSAAHCRGADVHVPIIVHVSILCHSNPKRHSPCARFKAM